MGDRPRALPRPRADARPIPSRSTAARSRARPAPCSIRSSACASASGSRPAASSRLAFATGVAPIATRRWRSPESTTTRAPPRARSRSRSRTPRAALRHLGISSDEARAVRAPRLARVRIRTARCAPSPDVLASQRARSGRPVAARHLRRPADPARRASWSDDVPLVRQVLQAQEYWRLKGLRADLVILNEHPVNYLDEMHAQLTGARSRRPWSTWQHRPGGVFLLRRRMVPAERVSCSKPSRARCSRRSRRPRGAARSAVAAGCRRPRPLATPPTEHDLRRRRRTRARDAGAAAGQRARRLHATTAATTRSCSTATAETPLPWTNVIANPTFGTIVTASGSALHLVDNSRENRLTPFANDPVSDPTGEAIFVRDDETGEVWAPTPGPLPRARRRRVARAARRRRHARFAHAATASTTSWTCSSIADDPVKVSRADADQHDRRRRGAQRLRLQRMGARPAARRPAALTSSPSSTTRRPARSSRRNAVQRRVRRTRGLLVRQRTRRVVHRRSRPSSSAATARWRARRR